MQNACEHYGGMEKWRTVRCIRLQPDRLTGLVPWLQGLGRTFAFSGAFEIAPLKRLVKFRLFPNEGHHGVFENGSVRIERASDSAIVACSADHRRTFERFGFRRWAPLDALYFFGYALSHYHALPFTLLDARLRSLSQSRDRSGVVYILDVEFPRDVPTHGPRQRFYIDETGRILRHDYHAEIIGFWARGAHFWKRETFCNGFPISLERQVFARVASMATPLTALHATFTEAEVELARA
ncbi:MAG TPA: hypothetical protein VIM73_12515 [Polyangiaceae bacterium]